MPTLEFKNVTEEDGMNSAALLANIATNGDSRDPRWREVFESEVERLRVERIAAAEEPTE